FLGRFLGVLRRLCDVLADLLGAFLHFVACSLGRVPRVLRAFLHGVAGGGRGVLRGVDRIGGLFLGGIDCVAGRLGGFIGLLGDRVARRLRGLLRRFRGLAGRFRGFRGCLLGRSLGVRRRLARGLGGLVGGFLGLLLRVVGARGEAGGERDGECELGQCGLLHRRFPLP